MAGWNRLNLAQYGCLEVESDMAKKIRKIVLLEGIHPVAVNDLRSRGGFEVEVLPKALNETELVALLPQYHAVGIRSKTQLSERVLKSCPNLMVVGAFCIGTNQIDLGSARKMGIPVFNAPYSNTRSVAELVICEIIALARRLGDQNRATHEGLWNKSAVGAREVRGKTLGIIGYGHIGSQVSVLAEALGMRVLFFDIVRKLPLGNSTPVGELEQLLERSDFVSLHVPETLETREMFGRRQFAAMKPGSFLINASRGNVVVVEDLVAVLKSGSLGGAAIDVFPSEPEGKGDQFKSPLQGLSNVILTPHVGGSTEEAQEAIGREVAESLARFFLSGSTLGAVNFPNVDLAIYQGAHRMINVHRNVPGVLGAINGIVSSIGANIRAQHLSTDQDVGYLVTDLDEAKADEVVSQVRKMEVSIKTWVV